VAAPTHNPLLPETDADALRIVSDAVGPSTGQHSIARLTAVQWVRTTIQRGGQFFSVSSPQPASGNLPAVTADSPLWVFEFHGDFMTLSRNGPGAIGHTLYMLLAPNHPGVYETEAPPIDLSQVGTVHVINRGDVGQIDALRAPDVAATPGAPTATPTP
jgi:hypothetical protein